MRPRLALCGAALALQAGLALAAPRQVAVARHRLENGLTLLVQVDRRLPLANVTCLYLVGSADDVPGVTGLAHFVEHMCFRASRDVSGADVTGFVERIGGDWGGHTSFDETVYTATVPSWALERVLAIEAARTQGALFEPLELECERTSVVAELQGYENDPGSVLSDLVLATSFEIHPYRSNIVGWLTDVLTVERDEAYAFYRDYYGPEHAVLAVVGDVDPDEVRALVEERFGALGPARRCARVRAVEPPQRGQKQVELAWPGRDFELLVAWRAPQAAHADYPVLMLLDALLAPRLERAVARAGGHGLETAHQPTRHPFVYTVRAAAAGAQELARVEAAILRQVARLAQEGPKPAEVARAGRELAVARALGPQELSEVAQRLALFEGLGAWELGPALDAAVQSASGEDVRACAARWLSPENRTVGRRVPPDAPVALGSAPIPAPPALSEPPSRPSAVPPRALEPLAAPALASARRRLENGAALRVATRDGATATVRVRLRSGGLLDPPGKEGLALLCARLVAEDEQLAALLSERGCEWSASASDDLTLPSNREHVDLDLRCLAQDLGDLLAALGRALASREVAAERLDQARESLAREIEALDEDGEWLARRAALAGAGCEPAFGTRASLARITAEDVAAFLARELAGGAVIVGALAPGDPAELLERVAAAFAALPEGVPSSPSSTAVPAREASRVEERVAVAGRTQALVRGALAGVPAGHPDALALRMLCHVLGETGYAGRLGERLVEPGLVYSVRATPELGAHGGTVLLATATATDHLERTLAELRATFAGLAEGGVEEWELLEAQGAALGGMLLALETDGGVARLLVESEHFGQDLLDLERRSAAVLAVTKERLDAAARRYLRAELLSIGVSGALPEPQGGSER